MFYFLYHLKNLILRTPFSYGHYRLLKKYRKHLYNFEAEKSPVRNKHYAKEGWKPKWDGEVHYRDYSSYEEYKTHQIQKYNEILNLHGGFDNKVILEYRVRFYKRLRYLPALLNKSAIILCLGARQGTEVEVLRDMGYKNAIGLDLNPGPENPYVNQGDFMNLEYPNESVDMIYSNCVDHAFDLNKFFQEHARVLRLDGFALYDLANQNQAGGGSFEAVEWKSEQELFLLIFKHFQKLIKFETDGLWSWLLLRKGSHAEK